MKKRRERSGKRGTFFFAFSLPLVAMPMGSIVIGVVVASLFCMCLNLAWFKFALMVFDKILHKGLAFWNNFVTFLVHFGIS